MIVMMKKLVIFHFPLISFCLILSDASYDELWKSYKVKYGKLYEGNNEVYRRKVWEQNIEVIAKHNLEAEFGLHSFRLGLNKFTDMTDNELSVYRRCLSHRYDSQETVDRYFECDRNCFASLPNHVDWREKGFVTPVKDQRDCGSCWAFSSTGALEGQIKAKYGTLPSLSEQNLVDCSKKQGNRGCNGGWMDYAFQYVIDNEGIDSEEAYPYKAKRKHCEFVRSGVAGNCTKYARIPEGSEKHLQAAVANIGPVAVAIDVEDKFMSYSSGIYFDDTCQSKFLDHAVLVVGYGERNGTDYWIVKNSWGPSWGMGGYILMRRNANNMCGIATHAVYPVV